MISIVFLIIAILSSISATPFRSDKIFRDEPQTRLSEEFWPEHYEITLTPYLEAEPEADKDEWTFDGTVKIKLKTKLPGLRTITLNANQLEIHDVKLYSDLDPDTPLGVVFEEVPASHLLIIHSLSDINQDEDYFLEISYMGYLNNDMSGFYRSTYYENGIEKRLAATQFQSYGARRAFPCFDEPKFKATFQLKVISLNKYHTLSNTRIEVTNLREDNRLELTFYKTPIMSSYLLAFIVSEFISRADGTFGVWIRPEMYNQTEYAFSVGPKILQYLDGYTQYPYYTTIDKMDMAAIPDFAAGAMENWGLVTYRERLLLFDEDLSTTYNKQMIATVIAHELAHMWFGDLVTCDTWDEIWLNEGFANYYEYFSTAKVQTEWDLDLQFVVESIQSAYQFDASNNTHPMTDPTGSGSIIYQKAGSVIRMLEHMMGKDEFLAGIREYLSVNAYDTAVPSKLYAALQNHVDESLDIADIMESWVDQEGFPVLQVNFNEARTQASLSQKRFLSQNRDHSDTLIYKIPITYANKNGNGFEDTSFKTILTAETGTLEVSSQDSWTIFNVQEVGFYRVNYDEVSWMLIRDGLLAENFDGIHILNRAQIVDDAFNLARGGILSYEIAFDILDYLDDEKNYIPWLAAYNGLSYIGRRFANHESEAFPKYVLKKFQNIYNHLGFYEREADTHIDLLNRANVLQWLCKYGHEECIEKARDEFEKAKSDSTYLVPVDIRQVVFCTGVKHGSDSDWDWLWQKFVNEQMATEQIIIMNALGCTNDEQTVYKFLDRIFEDNSAIRAQDRSVAFSSLYVGHDQNVDRIWNYVTNTANMEQISKSIGFGGLASYISGLSTRFVTRDQVSKLETFIEAHSEEFATSTNTLNSAVSSINYDLFWTSNYFSIIEPILIEKSKDGAITHVFNWLMILFGLIFIYSRH